MVEYSVQFDTIFQSLADSTRRDILRQVSKAELPITVIAASYQLSFAAVAKHISILERAGLVAKRRVGKQQYVAVVPKTVSKAAAYLEQYAVLWDTRFNNLDTLLQK